jgi:alkylhydroperoxidase family enzyme
MPRIAPSALGETTADRVMGHRPELLDAWDNLKHALLGPSSTLSPQLKEEVRRTLAQRTGCQFCASLGLPSEEHGSRQESLALAFADAAGEDHTAISDAQVDRLLDEFTVPETVELLIWICFEYAGQMFGSLIGDEPATPAEKDAFAATIAALTASGVASSAHPTPDPDPRSAVSPDA